MSMIPFIEREINLCLASDLPEDRKRSCIDKLREWLD